MGKGQKKGEGKFVRRRVLRLRLLFFFFKTQVFASFSKARTCAVELSFLLSNHFNVDIRSENLNAIIKLGAQGGGRVAEINFGFTLLLIVNIVKRFKYRCSTSWAPKKLVRIATRKKQKSRGR